MHKCFPAVICSIFFGFTCGGLLAQPLQLPTAPAKFADAWSTLLADGIRAYNRKDYSAAERAWRLAMDIRVGDLRFPGENGPRFRFKMAPCSEGKKQGDPVAANIQSIYD